MAGSSGGSAAAVAAGQVWLASGSDLGGSLRTPAGFNAVIGLRPSPGRVARGPVALPFSTLSVAGPIARTAADAALFLDALAGAHPEDPLSLPAPSETFLEAARAPRKPARIAYSPDLGLFPVAREVAEVCKQAADRFAAMGVIVEEACPDLSDAVPVFQILRAALYAAEMAPRLEAHRQLLKPEVIWNTEKGLALDAGEIGRAELARAPLYWRGAKFIETKLQLLWPTPNEAPHDVDLG